MARRQPSSGAACKASSGFGSTEREPGVSESQPAASVNEGAEWHAGGGGGGPGCSSSDPHLRLISSNMSDFCACWASDEGSREADKRAQRKSGGVSAPGASPASEIASHRSAGALEHRRACKRVGRARSRPRSRVLHRRRAAHLSPQAVATICCVTGWAGAIPCCHSAAGGAARPARQRMLRRTACDSLPYFAGP